MKKYAFNLLIATMLLTLMPANVESNTSSKTSKVGITFVESTENSVEEETLERKVKEALELNFELILAKNFSLNKKDDVKLWMFESMTTRITISEADNIKEYLIVNAP